MIAKVYMKSNPTYECNKGEEVKKKKCRCKKCVAFRKEYDFEYLDIFGLYHTISEFLVPRLEAFKNNSYSYPIGLTPKKWKIVLNKIIFSFKAINRDDISYEIKHKEKISEGINLFAEHFLNLWI